MSRKRSRNEMEDGDSEVQARPEEPSLLHKIRNMWQFASFVQYLYLFGRAVKAEHLDVEDFEEMLLQPDAAPKLADLALTLLKVFSSHRPLNLDTFDEVTRRQYRMKTATHHSGPFGDEEEAKRFNSFDILTKIRVLHQLSTWTFNNPSTIRERLDEDDLQWRMEPLGWDCDDCSYFVLDDDRLYRRTDAPLPATPPPKPKGKRAKITRSNKRRRLTRTVVDSDSDDVDNVVEPSEAPDEPHSAEDDGFGGMKWELVAITHTEYNDFLDTIKRSRDPNEKILRTRLMEDVMPVIEKRAEQLRQKEARRLKELENLQKLATAKRSGRLASKAEKRKQEEEEEAAERKRQADLAMAKKEQEKQRKLDEARESRMMTREQRLKDREIRRILHEEELKKLEEDKQKIESNSLRGSERHIKSEMERRQNELKELEMEEDWTFDCSICGVHGQNLDDGTHSIECETCKVWQHSKCHGISEKQADREDFHFICPTCKQKEKEAKEKIPPLKLKFTSPKTNRTGEPAINGTGGSSVTRPLTSISVPAKYTESSHSRSERPYMSSQLDQNNSPTLARPAKNEILTKARNSDPQARPFPNGLQWQPQMNGFQTNGSGNSPPIGSFYHYRPPSQQSPQGFTKDARPSYSPSKAIETSATASHSPSMRTHAMQSSISPTRNVTAAPNPYMPSPYTNGYSPAANQAQTAKHITPVSSFSAPPLAETPKPGSFIGPSSYIMKTPESTQAGSFGIKPGFSPAKQASPHPTPGDVASTIALQQTPILSPNLNNASNTALPVKRSSPSQPAVGPLPSVQAILLSNGLSPSQTQK